MAWVYANDYLQKKKNPSSENDTKLEASKLILFYLGGKAGLSLNMIKSWLQEKINPSLDGKIQD